MIYVTGDIHGEALPRFSYARNQKLRDLTAKDYVVILGDWGIVWNDKYSSNTIYQLEWMEEKPWTWVCLLGNHDNWDWALSLPKIETEIGEVRQCIYKNVVYENIYIVADPSVLEIDGELCFCIPGAESHDSAGRYVDSKGNEHSDLSILRKDNRWTYMDGTENPVPNLQLYRVEGKSWWQDEAIDVDSAGEILHYLVDNEVQVDYIFSHDAPAVQIEGINKKLPRRMGEIITKGEQFLQRVADNMDIMRTKAFLHGHLHMDRWVCEEEPRVMGLYHSIIEIQEGRNAFLYRGIS